MTRRDGMSNSGWINWPTHLHNTGEGGMFVYALFPVQDKYPDDFAKCCGVGSAVLVQSECLMEGPGAADWDEELQEQKFPLEREFFPGIYEKGLSDDLKDQSIACLAVVCLGSSGGSWAHLDIPEEEWKGMWICSKEDLTVEGKQLVESLENLYEREARLLTFLDT